MNNPVLKVTRFDSDDVIATSGGPAATGHAFTAALDGVICPNGKEDPNHFLVKTFDNGIVRGDVYYGVYVPNAQDGPEAFWDPVALNTWYCLAEDNWHWVVCGSGQ